MVVIAALPYLAHILGSTAVASRIMIGTCGLFFFMVGYARLRNVLENESVSFGVCTSFEVSD